MIRGQQLEFRSMGCGHRLKAAISRQARLRTTYSRVHMTDTELLRRITINPEIFGGKPIIRGRRLAVEHVLGMLSAGDTAEDLVTAYPWLEPDDVRASGLRPTAGGTRAAR